MARARARAAARRARLARAVRLDVPALVQQDRHRSSYTARPRPPKPSLSAFQAFSFVEAAVLLVSAGVLTMLFARAEGRAFQLPGGDGAIVMVAGGWTAAADLLPAARQAGPAGQRTRHRDRRRRVGDLHRAAARARPRLRGRAHARARTPRATAAPRASQRPARAHRPGARMGSLAAARAASAPTGRVALRTGPRSGHRPRRHRRDAARVRAGGAPRPAAPVPARERGGRANGLRYPPAPPSPRAAVLRGPSCPLGLEVPRVGQGHSSSTFMI